MVAERDVQIPMADGIALAAGRHQVTPAPTEACCSGNSPHAD
jgi:hypothetical protein